MPCRADVVTATCVGSGDDVLEDRRFRLCVIDEATQVCCNHICILALHLCLAFLEIFPLKTSHLSSVIPHL